MNSTNQNASFQTIASGQSHQDHVINAPKNRVNYHSGTARVVAGPTHRRPSTSTPLPRSVSDNWTSDILSLLEPKIENQSSASAEDFSFPLRDNLINFSNDSANMTEISNTWHAYFFYFFLLHFFSVSWYFSVLQLIFFFFRSLTFVSSNFLSRFNCFKRKLLPISNNSVSINNY